ncbi:hypothetical protein PV08_01957 [Exophiala spinifera]|uniref:Pre-rRNA-processing protein RIX1 n=1 Tax=Exophiala spinifera TaxID=91928 RepID=A0A0D2A9C4_9EURO|nr:uncharacterized protein PV08_01957 [Exophiala spinifera]KIW21377.1 hypothetical protein PV08_01957 [Exophiala spinifera]
METDDILTILSTSSRTPSSASTTGLRDQAHALILHTTNEALLPTTLHDLLTQIIKPLFTTTKHPNLTSTGRKNLVPNPPSFGPSYASLNDDDETSKPWKSAPFTVPLLKYILISYTSTPLPSRKATLESHFHLLIPPILNMIDDTDPSYKASGCHLLHMLSDILASVQSDMLKRTGLGDVFIDALKGNFTLLPTLTPEDESLSVLSQLYPAYTALVDAMFCYSPSPEKLTAMDHRARNDLLTALYRHGIMSSLEHLSSAASLSSTISVSLTVFLLRQIPPVFERTGISSVLHLKGLLPMLRAGLMDPFILVAPELVSAVLDVVECVISVCTPRVREKWYPEILRGLVGCWCNCLDESEGDSGTSATSKHLPETMARLTNIVKDLAEIVDKNEWKAVTRRLVDEEQDLKELFS